MRGTSPTMRRRDENGHGWAWKGGRHVDKQGYVRVLMPDHPHADFKGYVKEHLIVVCRALGRRLPPGAEVHHVNEDKTDNVPPNLVLCGSRAYHLLLHRRTRALNACGHPTWRCCTHCQKWDAPENLGGTRKQAWHRACQNEYKRQRWKIKGPGPAPRKTHCPRGHPLAGENLVKGALARGQRSCRICRNAQQYNRKSPGSVKGAHWQARDRAILGSAQSGEVGGAA